MKVRVLMFGALAEAASREDVFDIGDRAAVRDLVAALSDRYPTASPIFERCLVAVNHDVVDATYALTSDDEVAILPPMSGGDVWVRLSPAPSVADAQAAVRALHAGACVTFTGTVRGSCELGPVDRLEYTAYDPMADKVMNQIAGEAAAKWSLTGIAIDHALGTRGVGEVTFVVVCAAVRRDEAFDACRYVVDEVKARAPIWKKEAGPWGERWIGL